MDSDDTRPHLYLRAGGDSESLEQIRARARAWLAVWAPDAPELRIREFVDYVSDEIGSTALVLEERINAAVLAIQADAQSATTAPVDFAVCSECARRIPIAILTRETQPDGVKESQ